MPQVHEDWYAAMKRLTDAVDKNTDEVEVFLQALAKDSVMDKENITQEFTYVAAGNGAGEIETLKEYPTGADVGSPAKLTTYSYDTEDRLIKIEVTVTTV